jgi:hypothetical protein
MQNCNYRDLNTGHQCGCLRFASKRSYPNDKYCEGCEHHESYHPIIVNLTEPTTFFYEPNLLDPEPNLPEFPEPNLPEFPVTPIANNAPSANVGSATYVIQNHVSNQLVQRNSVRSAVHELICLVDGITAPKRR